jgi:fatty-acyl-CoA synthase
MISAANHVPLTPLSFLARARRAFPDKVAVVDADEVAVSYAELGRDCDALAGALRADGVQPGERVAVLDLNSRWLLAAHFAVPGAGAALVALNTRLAASEYRDILAHSRAAILLVSGELLPRLDVRTAGELGVRRVVLLPGTPATALPGATGYDEWLEGRDDLGLQLPADEDAMIAVNYTSGTTGRPKGVIYTHRGAYLNAVSVALEFELTAASCLLWTLPMFHCNGWSMTWGATVVGATHVCLGSFDAQRALDLADRYPVSHLCGAPVVLSELARAGAQRAFVAGRPLRAAVGGAPPTKETIAAVQKMGITVTHLYGLTETYGPSLVCEYQPGWSDLSAAELAGRLSRQGVPAVSVADVQVADGKLRPVPADGASTGEILIRSNTVAAGYLDDEAATAEAFGGGWFHTGDLGVMHPDGYIELTDRSKDIIISGGENIASVEVEKVLAAHPDVLEAAVVARPDPRWGERPVAFVSTERPDLSERELTEFVRQRLAHFKAPDQIYFEVLPKTSTGKIQKNVLRDRARDRNQPEVPGIDLAALERYLPTALADYDPAAGLTARLLTGGRSNLTCLLTQPSGRQWVLRRPPLGHLTPTAHDMGREFRTLSQLEGSGFPAPKPRALCTDQAVIGVTFLLYDYVPGRIIDDAATAGRLTEDEASRLSGELIRTLAQLHAIAPPAPEAGRSRSSIGYLQRQLTRWTDQWQRNQTRELPAFGQLGRRLAEELGRLSPDYPSTFVHGDYRLDNLILDPSSYQVRAVLDWEMSTFGDPLMDLALLLAYWEQPGDRLRRRVNVARNLTVAPGFWSRDRLLSEYLAATGVPGEHLNVCLGLTCLKLACIVEGIHHRHQAGQALDELSAGMADAAPALLELGLMVADQGLAGLAG